MLRFLHFVLEFFNQYLTKQIYAIVIMGEIPDQQFLIKRISDRHGWYFPGGRIGLFDDGLEVIKMITLSEIDGITIDDCYLIGSFWRRGYAKIYLITCHGFPSTKVGINYAKFVPDLSPYLLSTTSRKIQAFYISWVEKSGSAIKKRFGRMTVPH